MNTLRLHAPPASQSAPAAKPFFKEIYQRYTRDSLGDAAGALSYYFVFALFPFLFLLTTLTAYVPYFRTSADTLLSRARDILPPQAMQLVSAHVEGLVTRPRPRFLAMSLLLALYSASRGVDAVRAALNRAHDVQESRPWWKTEALALGMTAGGTLLVLGAVAGMAAGGSAGFWLATAGGRRGALCLRLALAPLAGHRGRDRALRGPRIPPAPRRASEVQAPHAGLAARDLGLVPRHLGLRRVRRAHRQLQHHLRRDRRRHRAHDLVLPDGVHLPAWAARSTSSSRPGRGNHYMGCGGRRTRPALRPSYESGRGKTMQVSLKDHFDLRHSVPMSREEEHRCALAYVKTKDPALAERLVVANMRMVVALAHHYCRADDDLRDFVQEGNRGLLHAVDKYDPTRGIKFCSYAVWWIRAYMLKLTMSNWRLVKVGTTQAQRKLFFSLGKERDRLQREGGEVNPRALAARLRVKESEVVAMLERFAGSEMSLETPVRALDADGPTLGDSLSDASAPGPTGASRRRSSAGSSAPSWRRSERRCRDARPRSSGGVSSTTSRPS